jgi:hypothetical protein
VAAANLALAFLLELAAMAAFAIWGATVNVAVAIAAPAVMVLLWAVFAAPRSGRRLPAAWRAVFQLTIFALAAVALVAAGSAVAGLVLAVVAAGNAVLLTALGQWDQ